MKDRSDDPLHHERTLLPQSYISLLVIMASENFIIKKYPYSSKTEIDLKLIMQLVSVYTTGLQFRCQGLQNIPSTYTWHHGRWHCLWFWFWSKWRKNGLHLVDSSRGSRVGAGAGRAVGTAQSSVTIWPHLGHVVTWFLQHPRGWGLEQLGVEGWPVVVGSLVRRRNRVWSEVVRFGWVGRLVRPVVPRGAGRLSRRVVFRGGGRGGIRVCGTGVGDILFGKVLKKKEISDGLK